MTDTQILTITIAIVFPVLGLVGTMAAMIYSNKRLDDFKSEITNSFGAFEKRITEKIDNGFDHMTMLLKLHEAEHHKK